MDSSRGSPAGVATASHHRTLPDWEGLVELCSSSRPLDFSLFGDYGTKEIKKRWTYVIDSTPSLWEDPEFVRALAMPSMAERDVQLNQAEVSEHTGKFLVDRVRANTNVVDR
jgi:hypothetical protein